MRDRLISSLDGACLFLRNRANAEPAPLNEYDIVAMIEIANICDEAAWILKKAVIPPCKVGQTVYRIVKMSTGVTSKHAVFVCDGKLHGTITPCKPTIKRFIRRVTVTKNNIIDCCENYGKTVFLTKEEAEAALKGGEG